jgi:hypothetical protein
MLKKAARELETEDDPERLKGVRKPVQRKPVEKPK